MLRLTCCATVILLITGSIVLGDNVPLYKERLYEPIIVYGSAIDASFRTDAPIEDLYLCAYDATNGNWRVMPFQIDERKWGADPHDPYKASRTMIRHSYFVADDSLFDDDDELVFISGDLGDEAPAKSWINNLESHQYGRIQITITDPLDINIKGYAYLYRSSTWKAIIPDKYNIAFDAANLTVTTYAYKVRMDRRTAMIRDILFIPPFGNDKDVFDTQKVRIEGYLFINNLPFYLGNNRITHSPPPAGNERDNFYVYPASSSLNYTQSPKVRVVVERWVTIKLGPMIVTPFYFPLTTKFYPNSGNLIGGANLNKNELKKYFDTGGTYIIELDMLRESWDFNENAKGMRFYNEFNDGLLVDGIPDNPNTTLEKPVRHWTLCTGEQGSLFTYTAFKDTAWKSTSLYYYDNKNGGYGDDAPVDSVDTGDKVSYGDQGCVLANSTKKDSINLELGFTAYFLPKFYTKEDAQKLAQWIENPLSNYLGSYFQTAVNNNDDQSFLDNFKLFGNYPNPFNNQTCIRFYVPRTMQVRLSVVNIHGQKVIELLNQILTVGGHEVKWNGTFQNGIFAPSGVYLYQLEGEGVRLDGKLLILK